MPTYIFEHPETGQIIEDVQPMNAEHTYVDTHGVVWNRVYTIPQSNIDTRLDPFSSNAFLEKTGKTKGKVQDLQDRSAELSEKRAQIAGGIDPIKQKYFDNYAKKRKGKEHPEVATKKAQEKMQKTFKNLGLT